MIRIKLVNAEIEVNNSTLYYYEDNIRKVGLMLPQDLKDEEYTVVCTEYPTYKINLINDIHIRIEVRKDNTTTMFLVDSLDNQNIQLLAEFYTA